MYHKDIHNYTNLFHYKLSSVEPDQHLDGRPLVSNSCSRLEFVCSVIDNNSEASIRDPSSNSILGHYIHLRAYTFWGGMNVPLLPHAMG